MCEHSAFGRSCRDCAVIESRDENPLRLENKQATWAGYNTAHADAVWTGLEFAGSDQAAEAGQSRSSVAQCS